MPRFLTVALVLIVAGPARAAPPDVDLTPTGRVGPKEIERLAQVLRTYSAAQAVLNDAKLREAVKALVRNSPGLPPEAYSDLLKSGYPTLPAIDQARLTKMVEEEQIRQAPPVPVAGPPAIGPPAVPAVQNEGTTPKGSDSAAQTADTGSATNTASDPKPAASAAPPPGVSPAQAKQVGAVAGWWEKNVGPLSETSAVRDVMTDFVKAATPASGKGPLADLFGPGDASDAAEAGGFRLSDLKSLNWAGTPAADLGVPAGGADFAGGGSLLLPLVAAAALGLGWYFWRKTPARRVRRAARAGLGPWPVDPRRLSTREELIRAFEYLSLKTLGPAAAHAHHVALTAGLRDRHPAAPDAADELGALYAVARYAPAADPFPADGLPAARAAFGRLGEGPE